MRLSRWCLLLVVDWNTAATGDLDSRMFSLHTNRLALTKRQRLLLLLLRLAGYVLNDFASAL